MGTKQEQLMPVSGIDLKGETVKDVLYLDFAGNWKQFWLFVSGRVLVLPVHLQCPAQSGTVEDLMKDMPGMVAQLRNEIRAAETTITALQEIVR